MKFGEVVTFLRIKEGLSREQLAQRVGSVPYTLWQYEMGGRDPRWSRAMSMLDALGYRIMIVKKKSGEPEIYE